MVARSNALTRSAANHQINKINNDRNNDRIQRARIRITPAMVAQHESSSSSNRAIDVRVAKPDKPNLRRTSRLSSGSSQSEESTVQSNSCRWLNCHWKQTEDNEDLLEHIIECHTQVQPLNKEDARELARLKMPVSKTIEHEFYICLWTGCRVYGRPSCSQDWLERHMPTHAGSRPFKCFVGACRMGFNRRSALERHVNSHFNASGNTNRESSTSSTNSETNSNHSGNAISGASGACKSSNATFQNGLGGQGCRQTGNNHHHHRQHYRKIGPSKNVDFFHEGIMEHIQYFLQQIANGQKPATI